MDNGIDEIIETALIRITFTTTQNQKNISNNISIVDLLECETLLRENHKIPKSVIYMIKIDAIQKGMKIPKVEYDLYSQLTGRKLEKLNLKECQMNNKNISLLMPVIIDENYDKLNSSSGYYNDVCYQTTSNSGTDIIIKDRKKEYIYHTICQDDCTFIEYNYIIKKANCSCKAKGISNFFADMTINKTKLYQNFINIKNIANFNILICYKKLFNKKSIIYNIGFYIISLILLFHLVSIFIFYMYDLDKIYKKINDIIFGIKHIKLLNLDDKINNKEVIEVKENKKENKIKQKKKANIMKNKSSKLILSSQKNNKNPMNKNNNDNNSIIKKNNSSKINIKNNIINENHTYIMVDSKNKNIKNSKKNIISKTGSHKNLTKHNSELTQQKLIQKVKNIMEYKNEEKNLLSYELAIQYDKRTYCEYYISLLKTKHNFIFSFFNNNDYNSKIIKIDIFFINLATNYTINALFFDDDTMHKIYEIKGSFDIEYLIPKIIYSSFISMILNSIVKLLALSNDRIIDFKYDKSKENINIKRTKLNKNLRIKFLFYFVVVFIFLLFFLYYISLFGVIYKNTQYHLLKDTLISFGLSLIYPFGIYLLPGICRIPALSKPKMKRKLLYNFSKKLQIF